jgi:hypothetical protein
MESVATRIHESSNQLARQRSAFVSRTREAGVTFLGETRDAGRQLVGAVQSEAKRWKRFATQRADQLRAGAKTALSIPAVERSILTQVDDVLKALDARVRSRIAELEGKPRKALRSKPATTPTKGSPRTRKSKQTLPAIAA